MKNWITFNTYKNHAARLVLYKPNMWVQHHCSEDFTGFQWRLESNTKLHVSLISVSIITICHIFLTFFIYTIPLHCCALLTSLRDPHFSLETFGKRFFSIFWPHCPELPAPISQKSQHFSTFLKNLKTHLFNSFLTATRKVSVTTGSLL